MTIRMIKAGVIKPKPKYEWFGECIDCGCQMLADEFPKTSPPSPPRPGSDGVYEGNEYFIVKCMTCPNIVGMNRRPETKAKS